MVAQYFRLDGFTAGFVLIPPEDLPVASAVSPGVVLISGNAADLQPLGSSRAGSTGCVADAAHVHPVTGVATVDASGAIQADAGIKAAIRTITSNQIASVSDSTILLNRNGLTLTLPPAVTVTGRVFTVKLITQSSGSILPYAGELIDGSSSYSLTAQHKYVSLHSDGSGWWITSNN